MSSLSEGSDIKNLNDIVYHVIVSIEGGSIIAKDVGGNVISSGVAGIDDSRVITEAITFVPDNGNVLILTSPEFRHTCEVHPGFRAVSW